MPTNIEIKAVLTDRVAAERIATRLSEAGPEVIQQEDHFFPCASARLKLRILAPDRGELIRCDRNNLAEARPSNYLIARTTDPYILLEILTAALGRSGSVKKTRRLYLVGQTRIHIDQVEGLGDFLELEVVLRPGQSKAEGKSIAARLLSEFDINQRQLLADAYIDLLQRQASQTGMYGPPLCRKRKMKVTGWSAQMYSAFVEHKLLALMECAARSSYLVKQPWKAFPVYRFRERRVRPLCHHIVRQQTWQKILNSVVAAGL